MIKIGYINPKHKKRLGERYVWGNVYRYGNPHRIIGKNLYGRPVVCFGHTFQYGKEV